MDFSIVPHSFGEFLGLVVTIASFVVPFWLKRYRRRKRREQHEANFETTFALRAVDSRHWLMAEAKILSFEFAKTNMPAPKQLARKQKYMEAPLVALVEYIGLDKLPVQAQVYLGDAPYSEGDTITIKYNQVNAAEVVFTS